VIISSDSIITNVSPFQTAT